MGAGAPAQSPNTRSEPEWEEENFGILLGWLLEAVDETLCSLGPGPCPRRILLEGTQSHIDGLTRETRRRSLLGGNVVLLLLIIMDAWLFTTAKYLSSFAEGSFPARIRGGAGGQEKDISARTAQGPIPRKNAQRPPAASQKLIV